MHEQSASVVSRRFHFHSCLGRGGFGEVYRATMEGSGGVRTEVAVKILRADIDPGSDAVKRLRDEGRLLGAVRHPAILRVHDLVLLDGRVGLVTEFVDGDDLDACIQAEPPMPLRVLLGVVGEVAAALDVAWNSRAPGTAEIIHLVHRDVKPANVRIGRHGEVKLLDFGIARAANVGREAQTASNAMMGSSAYMAPERFHSDDVLPPSDVYSLGCLLFEGMTRRRFFQDRNLKQIYGTMLSAKKFDAHLRSELERVADAPEEVRTLIRRLLDPDPDTRPTAAEVARRCEDLVEDLTGPTLKRWCRSREWPPPRTVNGSLSGSDLTAESFVSSSMPTPLPQSVGSERRPGTEPMADPLAAPGLFGAPDLLGGFGALGPPSLGGAADPFGVPEPTAARSSSEAPAAPAPPPAVDAASSPSGPPRKEGPPPVQPASAAEVAEAPPVEAPAAQPLVEAPGAEAPPVEAPPPSMAPPVMLDDEPEAAPPPAATPPSSASLPPPAASLPPPPSRDATPPAPSSPPFAVPAMADAPMSGGLGIPGPGADVQDAQGSANGWLGDAPAPAPDPIPGVFDEPVAVTFDDDDAFEAELAAMQARKRRRSVMMVVGAVAVVALLGLLGGGAILGSALLGEGGHVDVDGAVAPTPDPAPADAAPAAEPDGGNEEPEPEPEPEPAPKPKPKPKPPSAKGDIERGWELVDSKRNDEALGLFQKSLQADANDADANYGVGYVLLKMGRGSEAKPYLCKALALGDTDTQREVVAILPNSHLLCP